MGRPASRTWSVHEMCAGEVGRRSTLEPALDILEQLEELSNIIRATVSRDRAAEHLGRSSKQHAHRFARHRGSPVREAADAEVAEADTGSAVQVARIRKLDVELERERGSTENARFGRWRIE